MGVYIIHVFVVCFSISPDMTLPMNHMAVVSYTGVIQWIPPISLETHCPIDLSYFPFDTQICKIKIGSWTYHEQSVSVFYVFYVINKLLHLFLNSPLLNSARYRKY